MRLDVHMTPRQYRDGFPQRITRLLATGTFGSLAGVWRVRRQLALLEAEQRGLVLRQVTFDLVPLDTTALRIAQRQLEVR